MNFGGISEELGWTILLSGGYGELKISGIFLTKKLNSSGKITDFERKNFMFHFSARICRNSQTSGGKMNKIEFLD